MFENEPKTFEKNRWKFLSFFTPFFVIFYFCGTCTPALKYYKTPVEAAEIVLQLSDLKLSGRLVSSFAECYFFQSSVEWISNMFHYVYFLAVVSTTAFLTLQLLSRLIFGYWRRRGVKQLTPFFPVGDLLPLLKQEVSVGEFYEQLYHRTKAEPFVGIYNFYKPGLLINDPDLIKNIMIRDFATFPDRGVYSNALGNLFSLSGHKWKTMHGKLTIVGCLFMALAHA